MHGLKLIEIIEADKWMIEVLEIARSLELNDCWIGAGFFRNKVWDFKHNKARTPLNDIDIIYFDKSKTTAEDDFEIENKLKLAHPGINWSVRNQSRMHLRNNHKAYKNCEDAISYWPETATAIAVRLGENNQVEYIAPYGLSDLFNLIVKPTPKTDIDIFNNRVENKRWKTIWEMLTIQNRM
jgi:hypothetical protein